MMNSRNSLISLKLSSKSGFVESSPIMVCHPEHTIALSDRRRRLRGPRSAWNDWRYDWLATTSAPAGAVVASFLFFLIKLRTVSDGCAPLLIQYSARSSLIVLL